MLLKKKLFNNAITILYIYLFYLRQDTMFYAKIIYLNFVLDKHSIKNEKNKYINKIEFYFKNAIGKDFT